MPFHQSDGETEAPSGSSSLSQVAAGVGSDVGLSCIPLHPASALQLLHAGLGFRRKPPSHSDLIHSTRLCAAQSGGEMSTLQKSYERNYGWKNHYLINRPSCSELVGNRAYKIHMARWGFDSASLQPSDSSEKCPHPERANFPLLMTQGGAGAINSSYLRAWGFGQMLLRELSLKLRCPTPVVLCCTQGKKKSRGWPPAAQVLSLQTTETQRRYRGMEDFFFL